MTDRHPSFVQNNPECGAFSYFRFFYKDLPLMVIFYDSPGKRKT